MKTADRVRELNDAFRTNPFGGTNRVVITSGVQALGPELSGFALAQVVKYTAFNDDNDPFGEHDFGSLEVAGHKLFWKIDLYDKSMENASPDPSNPEVTTRILTIMLISEW